MSRPRVEAEHPVALVLLERQCRGELQRDVDLVARFEDFIEWDGDQRVVELVLRIDLLAGDRRPRRPCPLRGIQGVRVEPDVQLVLRGVGEVHVGKPRGARDRGRAAGRHVERGGDVIDRKQLGRLRVNAVPEVGNAHHTGRGTSGGDATSRAAIEVPTTGAHAATRQL